MPLIDDIEDGTSRTPCAIQRAIDARPDLADELLQLMARPDIGHRQLANACRKNGLYLSDFVIRRHRAGDCVWCTRTGRTWV